MDDDSLLRAAAGGDERALRELFSRHAPWLAARLRRVLAAHAMEDVVQKTFVAVWRGAGAYRPEGYRGRAPRRDGRRRAPGADGCWRRTSTTSLAN